MVSVCRDALELPLYDSPYFTITRIKNEVGEPSGVTTAFAISPGAFSTYENRVFGASLTKAWDRLLLLSTHERKAVYLVVPLISSDSRTSDCPAMIAFASLSVAATSRGGNGSFGVHTTLSSHAQSSPPPLPSSSLT